eukprot:777577-Prymnesium_polylepis.1
MQQSREEQLRTPLLLTARAKPRTYPRRGGSAPLLRPHPSARRPLGAGSRTLPQEPAAPSHLPLGTGS